MYNVPDSFRQRFETIADQTRAARRSVRADLAAGKDPEPDRVRSAAVAARRAAAVAPQVRGAESVIGDDDMQAAWFLPSGAHVRRGVGLVQTVQGSRVTQGTGFLISPGLFLTNQHVLNDADAARSASITFDYEIGEHGGFAEKTVFRLDPDRCAVFSPLEKLDYALIALGPRESGPASVEDLGYLILSNRPDKHKIGMSVNIVQHPNGLPKLIAVRHNLLEYRTDTTLLYETDTDEGSSGSPVLNDEWEVVALHHYGSPFVSHQDDQGRPIVENVNEGLRISAIYTDLETRIPSLPATAADLLTKALGYDNVAASPAGRRLTPPSGAAESATVPLPSTTVPSPDTTVPLPHTEGAVMNSSGQSAVTVTVPLEITVRLGATVAAPAAAAAPVGTASRPAVAPRELAGGSEAVVVDTDYSNRAGFDKRFIRGLQLPIPALSDGSPFAVLPVGDDAGGELKYTHYSVVLNKTKKMALVTATNIDGTQFRQVNRTTGQVSNATEGDRWFVDPRVPATSVPGQQFYTDWSEYFDRGHLTRREDTNWGADDDESERGNADTFHFTNCTPQHFLFNQSTEYWQGAERYVLENGTLQEGDQNRLCVFQGPIFDNKADMKADTVQVPSRFFKVIVWRGHDGNLKSVGLIVDQSSLLDIKRGDASPKRGAPDIQQFRVEIAEIEKDTGLDFGADVRNADTYELKNAPVAGERKAAILLRSQTDVLPALEHRKPTVNGVAAAVST